MTLRKEDMHLVQLVLTVNRKHKHTEHSLQRDEQDIEEVIDALHTCGYVVISKGVLDALRDLLKIKS